MSGIYIPGMEMPTSCEKCPFLDYEVGFCLASGVKGKSGWYESTLCPGEIKGGRHDECPLIPVPEHGDLIDRKVALDSLLNGMAMTGYQSRAMDCVGEWYVPTIIPADKGENE